MHHALMCCQGVALVARKVLFPDDILAKSPCIEWLLSISYTSHPINQSIDSLVACLAFRPELYCMSVRHKTLHIGQ